MGRLFRAVSRHTSAEGMGFAGAGGLVASGLTDLASVLGPFLTWFVVVASVSTLLLGFVISRHEKRVANSDVAAPSRIRFYCHSFVVLLGSLFGSIVLLASGLVTDNEDGSNILALVSGLRDDVQRVEERVGEVQDSVGEVQEGVEGLGEAVVFRDITGRSGTGKIGQQAKFAITLANERRMQDVSCELSVQPPWDDHVAVVDDTCDTFTVQLPQAPVLDDSGRSLGDVVAIPFELRVVDSNNDVVSRYANSYPLHNNYGTIDIVLEPPGNRFRVDESRAIRVDVGDAELTDAVECEWTVFDPVKIRTTSANGCIAELDTRVDKDSYVYKRLVEEGRIRDDIYVQINSAADFSMLGNATLTYQISP
jgi:hypothetical protein